MEEEIKHKWIKGVFIKESFLSVSYLCRKDVCALCGCERTVLRFYSRGTMRETIASFHRNRQVFSAQNMPECWGDKNPK